MSDEPPSAGGTGETGDALKRRRPAARDPEEQAQRLRSGDAWEAFLARLADTGRRIRELPLPDHPELRAEGFRYLLGLVRSGIDQALHLEDPDQPRFLRNPDSLAKWGAENADNQYLWARVRSDARYRLHGRRRGVFEFLIETKEGYMQLGDDAVYDARTAADLELDDDGCFEILLSAERPPDHAGDWMPLHPDARYVTIRQYLVDWEREQPAHFAIERIGGPGEPAAPLSDARMADILDSAGLWVDQTQQVWDEWIVQLREAYRPGEIAAPKGFVGGADAIAYGNDWFRLGPDEALIFESELPDARYWAIQLCNVWFTTMDYATRQTSLNPSQAHVDADGRLRCVIAHRDPGVPNWLDTCSHPEGMIQYRWIWTTTRPRPTVRIVPFAELRDHLPPDTPVVDADARKRAIATRARHLPVREPAT